MRIADIAQDFGSDHPIAAIDPFRDMRGINGFEITGPATARIKFCVGFEKWCFTAYAPVDTMLVMIPVLAGEGTLGGAALGDLELLGAEALTQGLFSLGGIGGQGLGHRRAPFA
jgi:hypothetical protein